MSPRLHGARLFLAARGPEPPACPVSQATPVPRAATTWKLCIPWKLFMLTGGFISAGCKVSTLNGGQAPTARLTTGARSPRSPRLP